MIGAGGVDAMFITDYLPELPGKSKESGLTSWLLRTSQLLPPTTNSAVDSTNIVLIGAS